MLSIAGIVVDILFVIRLAAQKDRNEKPDTNAQKYSLADAPRLKKISFILYIYSIVYL